MTESTLLSVIGVDTRLLEPLRRGSLRGRGAARLRRVANLQAHGVPKSMFFSLCFYEAFGSIWGTLWGTILVKNQEKCVAKTGLREVAKRVRKKR